MSTLFEVLLWLLGEVCWKLIVPYFIIFGIAMGLLRLCMPTWHDPSLGWRVVRSMAWGLNLGLGNNNRRGWFLFPVLLPFVLYWGLTQQLGPATLPGTIKQVKELVPAAEQVRKDYAPGIGDQLEGSLYNFQQFMLGKEEADRRRKERKDLAPIREQEAKARIEAASKERRDDWSRWYVGITVVLLYPPFVLVYGLLAGREEISGWAERIVASRNKNTGRPSGPAPATTSGTSGTQPALAGQNPTGMQRALGFLGMFEVAEVLLHFYHLMPGGRR